MMYLFHDLTIVITFKYSIIINAVKVMVCMSMSESKNKYMYSIIITDAWYIDYINQMKNIFGDKL